MKKISTKIIAMIIVSSVLVSVLVGGISIRKSGEVVRNEALKLQLQLSRSTANEINLNLADTEASVRGMVTAISATIDENGIRDNEYMNKYQTDIQDLIKDYAEKTKGAMGAYIAFDPTLTGNLYEVWFADAEESDKVSLQPLGDISDYKEENKSTEWYYRAKNAKQAYGLIRIQTALQKER